MDNRNLIYELTTLINKARGSTNDIQIAKMILEHRYELESLSLDELASMSYFSQATLSRFIKKLGYKNYEQFKRAMAVSFYQSKEGFEEIQSLTSLNTPQMIDKIYQDILKANQNIFTLDLIALDQMTDLLFNYKNIVFIGSELSMSMINYLTTGLINLGFNAYALYDIHFQKEWIPTLQEDTLLIVISIEARWFIISHILDLLKQTTCFKMLWTIDENHPNQELFDSQFYFGKTVEHNMGYHELMYFCYLMFQLMHKKAKEH